VTAVTADRITIRAIQALGRHGVLPEEQERAQPFEVDIEIEADLGEAGRLDDLASTVDYGRVIEAVVKVVEQGRYALIEALAAAVATEVLADPRAEAVTVEVRKLRPPVAAAVGSAGVRIRRTR
jgi:dihydroneopterin aldolase